jgi:hypothetical protein
MNTLYDNEITGIQENAEGLIIEKAQYIDPVYLDSLKQQRSESKHRKEGEYMRVASIPVAVIDKWLNEGFDFWNEPAKKILAKLKEEGLDYFITTDKQV